MKQFLFNFIIFLTAFRCTGAPLQTHHAANPEKELMCFIYHRFDDKRYPSTNTTTKDFEAHLQYLKNNNYDVLTLSDALDYLKSNAPVKKVAVITVDDGYKTFYSHGLPLLRKYKMPATLFINTKTVGAPDFMDWVALKDLLQYDIEIGNHTHSHSYFLNESAGTRYQTFGQEIDQSQAIIKEHLNVVPTSFSFPYGEFDEGMKDVVKKKGFTCAAAQNSGAVGATTDLFQIPRFPMAEAYSKPSAFAEKARTHPLKIIQQSPDNVLLSAENLRPTLTLTVDATNLRTDQLQCFVQGTTCSTEIINKTDSIITVTLRATQNLSTRRRTLYTLTIPDKQGQWHWFSRLWVNAKVK